MLCKAMHNAQYKTFILLMFICKHISHEIFHKMEKMLDIHDLKLNDSTKCKGFLFSQSI